MILLFFIRSRSASALILFFVLSGVFVFFIPASQLHTRAQPTANQNDIDDSELAGA